MIKPGKEDASCAISVLEMTFENDRSAFRGTKKMFIVFSKEDRVQVFRTICKPVANALAEGVIQSLHQCIYLRLCFKGGWKYALATGVTHRKQSVTACLGCTSYFASY